MSFLDELKRRNVLRVVAAYAVVAWLFIQVAETVFPLFGFGDSPARIVVIVSLIGVVPAAILAWVFEITPDGMKLDRDVSRAARAKSPASRTLDKSIVVLLALAVSYFAFDKFVLDPSRDEQDLAAALEQGRVEALIESYGDNAIAVLPFLDLSPEKDQEYMSDGIAEELLNLLGRIPQLRVTSRSSAFAFKNKEIDVAVVAEKLNVNYVLEGSVRKAGERLRVTAKLIEAASDTQLWSETYDRNLADVFEIQDEISASISQSLKIKLLAGENVVNAGRTSNTDAYNAYLIGLERLGVRTQSDIEAAVHQFEKALLLDDDFSLAHVQLAHARMLLETRPYGGKGAVSDDEHERIRAHIEVALELSPNLPEAYGVQGFYHLRRGSYKPALESFDRAIAINPSYAMAYNWRADLAAVEERFLDMLVDRETAYALDPMSLQISADLAREYRDYWRPEDAERVIERMFDLHPDHPLAFESAILNLGMHGRHAEAQLMNERAVAAHPGDPKFAMNLAVGAYFLRTLDALEGPRPSGFVIRGHLANGDLEQAWKAIEVFRDEPGHSILSLLFFERSFHRLSTASDSLNLLRRSVNMTIEEYERRGIEWRDRCETYMIHDLRIIGHPNSDDVDRILAACKRTLEMRLDVGYLCPCQLERFVMYTILDGRLEEAIIGAEQWMDSGWSTPDLAVNPIFKLLSENPKYHEILKRNENEVQRQRQVYFAGKAEANELT